MSSAFKSTTKRSSIAADDADSRAARSHRRSRSLSRFSRRASTAGDYETPARRGKFVNTHRGAGFPEMSLDDLALEIFESADRWRSGNRSDGVGKDTCSNSSSSCSSQMRGRSVSRQLSSGGGGWSRSDGVAQKDSANNRKRSVSVAPYHNSDTESEVDGSGILKNRANQKRSSIGSGVTHSLHKPDASNLRQLSRRSLSSRDLLKLHDGYSSQSSALTDEEPRNTGVRRNGAERIIRTVIAQKTEHPIGEDINSGFCNAMRKELRNAVEDIRLGLEQAMVHNNTANNSGIFQPASVSMGKNRVKLDKKQDLSDGMLMDGELDPEISKIVRDFLLDSENDTFVEKAQTTKKRINDKRRMSAELIQEAEQYFEDFLSNVEDTDLSSFEGERSDCGSSVGGIKRSNNPVTYFDKTDTFRTPPKSSSTPVEMDGVVLPWLQWETANDTTPASCNQVSDVASAIASSNAPQSQDAKRTAHHHRYHSISSINSSSPEAISDKSPRLGNRSESGCIISEATYKTPYFEMDDYMDIARNEELTMESWRKQSRISNGSVHFCSPMFL